MRTRIKICGITRREDALHAARSGADAVGLIFYAGSARHVEAEQARAIALALPPFITKVGLFVNATSAQVEAVLARVPLDLLQFHGDETPRFCAQFSRPYIKALRVGEKTDLLQYARDFSGACALLLDAQVQGHFGGTGHSFDWRLIPPGWHGSGPRRPGTLPLVLSGGLNPDNVSEAVRQVRPWAVDVSSGVEAAKGIKDTAKIERFIRGVRDGDAKSAANDAAGV